MNSAKLCNISFNYISITKNFSCNNLREEKIEYFFNQKKQIISHKKYLIKEKNTEQIEIARYKYNKNNQLTVLHSSSNLDDFYDSLSYDSDGSILSYYSHRIIKDAKTHELSVNFNLKRIQNNKKFYLLADSNANVIYKLNYNNDILLVYPFKYSHELQSINRSDSITYKNINDSLYVTYYVKNKNNPYTLGEVVTYFKGKIISIKTYDSHYNKDHFASKTTFIYNNGSLIAEIGSGNSESSNIYIL